MPLDFFVAGEICTLAKKSTSCKFVSKFHTLSKNSFITFVMKEFFLSPQSRAHTYDSG